MRHTISYRRISPALLLLALSFLVPYLSAQPTTTRVLDVIYDGTGGLARGTIEVAINVPCVVSGNYISGVVVRKALVNGVFDVNLVPNTNCLPANTRYIARYRLTGTPEYSEEWLVPISGTPVLISTIKQNVSVLPSIAISISQLTGCVTVGHVPQWNGTGFVCVALPGGGDALTANSLAQFAPTTSAQLAGVISDETGTGFLVFATAPTVVGPVFGNIAEATCDASLRGKLAMVHGGAGVADSARICSKTHTDQYEWRPIL